MSVSKRQIPSIIVLPCQHPSLLNNIATKPGTSTSTISAGTTSCAQTNTRRRSHNASSSSTTRSQVRARGDLSSDEVRDSCTEATADSSVTRASSGASADEWEGGGEGCAYARGVCAEAGEEAEGWVGVGDGELEGGR